jgi:hypothetical protein
MYQFSFVKFSSASQDGNLVLLELTSVAGQIQRFDFDWNLVLTRKQIVMSPPALRGNPLYEYRELLKNRAWIRA